MKENIRSIVPVIIPALEPDGRLTSLVRDLAEAEITPIVLLDDGSGESYRANFEKCRDEYGCILLRHAVNLGKGRALKDAFNYCLNTWPELVGCVTADSDGQHSPECIRKVRNALLKEPEHLVLGVRDFNAENVPTKSRLGNRITCHVCSAVCGIKVSDTQTGLRAIPAAFMRELMPVKGERFEFETQMLVEAKEKCSIREVSIKTIYDSKENHTTHFNPLKDSLRIYRIFCAALIRYIASSLGSGVIDISLFLLICRLLRGRTPMYIAAATVFARIVSAACNYALNYSLVFRSKAKRTQSAVRYIILAFCVMCFSAFFVSSAVHFLPENFSELCVKLPVDSFLFFVSYIIQRDFVYNKGQ